ncbi:hypothetical protein PYCC9005_003203 [Savitreella phatthalungensis]
MDDLGDLLEEERPRPSRLLATREEFEQEVLHNWRPLAEHHDLRLDRTSATVKDVCREACYEYYMGDKARAGQLAATAIASKETIRVTERRALEELVRLVEP